MDPGKKRHNELRYEQELRRDIVLESGFPCCIVFCSSFTLFKTLAISFSTMTLFTRIAPPYGSSLLYAGLQNRICLSLGCSFSWPQMGPFASWCCAWLETTGLVAGIGTQGIILLSTGTNKNGGYFAPKWLFLCMYIGLTLIWAVLNTFALEVIASIDVISICHWRTGYCYNASSGGTDDKICFMCAHTFRNGTRVDRNIKQTLRSHFLSFLVTQYSLYGHLTEETKAQILYDAFHGRHHNSAVAIVLLLTIWGSFFFRGLSITTNAASVVHALSRDEGIPFSSIWQKIHPKHEVPSNAVWLCAAICILLGLTILKVNVVSTAITSTCTIGWVGGYAVPIFARMVMAEKHFKAGPILPRRSKEVALVAGLILIMLWRVFDARELFKGPVRNIDNSKWEGISSITNSTLDVFIGTP
ncbi:hypothetical protein NC652_013182 [Populus alba x Populus x berolinensis]|nr:hypothetical protein NC652_013182 [Populus alba x Populus x berolinensis]